MIDGQLEIFTLGSADPNAIVHGGAAVDWSGQGQNRPGVLYWGRRAAVWNDNGDVVQLADTDGRLADRRSYRRNEFPPQ